MAESLLNKAEEEIEGESEADKYIRSRDTVEDRDSTPKAFAFAQGLLELLKPIDQGGNMTEENFSNMMQEVQIKLDERKKGFRSKGKEKALSNDRVPKQEGGILVPPEMEMEATEATEAPVDTYPNIPPGEMAEVEASQLPDEEMEVDYVDFVMSEALVPEEQEYLRNTLEADPQLSMIFDKVVETASEFSGSGEVAGPGTGVSDSIPARLSDGEFVVTKKATDRLGADNLQLLMDEAERAFDGGLMERDKSIEDEEIRKAMVASNQMPSLNVRQR